MELHGSDIQVLVDLGLTLVQAKVYMVLSKSLPIKAAEISRLASIARPDVYRTLSRLQNEGLVEEIVETPRLYRAVPMEKGVTSLLKRRIEEQDILRKNAELLLKKYKENNGDRRRKGNGNRFVIIPRRERIVNRIRKAIEESQRTVDLVLSLRRFLFGMTAVFAESAKRAWSRGVKFRFIVEKPEEAETTEYVRQFLRKNPSCEIRFLHGRPRTVIGLYDNREAFLVVEPGGDLFDSPALWSNSQSLLAVLQDYFETLWLVSSEKLGG